MKPPAFQFYADDACELVVGSPNKPGVASAYLDAHRLIVGSVTKSSEEIGLLIMGILQDLKAHNLDSVRAHPFITKVKRGATKRLHIPRSVRTKILRSGICAYCGARSRLSIDHIFPVSKGGTNDDWNLQCLCLPCNISKSNRTQ